MYECCGCLGVQVWHLWLAPWRRVHTRPQVEHNKLQKIKNTVTDKVIKDTVPYDAQIWDCYVAANLHFYTTLFVLFMQAPTLTRDLGLSSNTDGVYVLSTTLSLFSPSLVKTLDVLNKGYELSLCEQGQQSSGLRDMADAVDISLCLQDCITLQDQQLFPGLASHESCAVVDFRWMIRLQTKHMIEMLRGRRSDDDQGYLEVGVKALVDGLMSLIGIPVAVLSADRHQELKEIEVKLCGLSGLQPSDLTGLDIRRSGETNKSTRQDADRVTELSNDASLLGTLTPVGKAQVLQGQRMCEKESIAYRKDPLFRPFLSTDLQLLVKNFVYLSKTWNNRFDLPACKDSIYLTWGQMIEREVFRYETIHGASDSHVVIRFFYNLYLYTLNAFRCIPQGFRFNVRCLGNVIFLCKLGVVLCCVIYYVDGLSGGCFGSLLMGLLFIMRAFGWHYS